MVNLYKGEQLPDANPTSGSSLLSYIFFEKKSGFNRIVIIIFCEVERAIEALCYPKDTSCTGKQ